MSAPPRIHEHREEQREALMAWLAPYRGLQPSYVQAAVANFDRALADLRLLLEYEMDSDHQFFRRYRDESEIHVWLIGTLASELTRAINLVIARAQQRLGRGGPHAAQIPKKLQETDGTSRSSQ
jgi:hypothetical protein